MLIVIRVKKYCLFLTLGCFTENTRSSMVWCMVILHVLSAYSMKEISSVYVLPAEGSGICIITNQIKTLLRFIFVILVRKYSNLIEK